MGSAKRIGIELFGDKNGRNRKSEAENSSFVQFDWSLFDIICLFIPNSTVPLLASFLLPFLLSPLSLSLLSLSALALLGVTGVGRCCKRLVGVAESAPAFVFFNIIFIWGVYIGLVRQVFSPLLDVILNAEFSMLVIGLCSILTTDPGYVTNESSHHNQLVESPVSVFEAHSEVENVEKPLQLDMNHIINTDIEIIFWSRNWCLQLVTFPTSLLLKKILFHFRESDIVGTARHL
ncbi:unnamed protein product [Camellia sinensis]